MLVVHSCSIFLACISVQNNGSQNKDGHLLAGIHNAGQKPTASMLIDCSEAVL